MFKDVALNKLQEIYVEEEVISSRKDITSSFLEKRDTCCNLKNWNKNEYNILFITGLSGSGKTTLGVDMKKEFNCKRVELDYIVVFYMKRCNASRKDRVYNLVKEECEEAVEFFDNNKDTWSIDTWAEHEPISRAFLDWFTSKFEGNGQLYIINGAQIPDVCDVEYFEERPIIVKDSNAIKSVLRRTHREIDEETLIKKIIQFSKHIKMITRPEYIKSSIRMTKFAKDINNESYIEESSNQNIYYRVTYNNIGIYEALKQNIDSNIWKDLLKSSNINWLPKPPLEYNSNISYFTEEGYKIFKKKTLPDIEKYLNKENIYTEEISAYTIKDNIVYSDKYQVVISNTIQEASSYDRKYRCPYCDKLYKRKDLPSHIENKHEDLIPQEMTPLQVTFNSINNKTHGVCTECGGESPWNEAKGRYDRICGKKSCHDSYVKTMKSRMVKKYGREHNLNDAQVQANMLKNRKISGTYIWSDRTKFSYCGSYEKNLLEFLDKVLECKSEDILTPGPVIEYSYNGEIHQWITDLYYIPYNLCFDVKDGGDNPNNKPMKEYRDKQEAKEIAIIEQNKYNYIRLTDNNFTQLFEIFLELKMKLEDSNEKVVHINEQCSTTLNALPNINAEKGQYIIQYMAKNTFTKGYAYTTNNELTDDIHIIDNFGKENIIYRDQFLNMVEEYTIYKYIGDHIEESYNYTTYPIDYFYIKLTGRRLIDENQILVDSEFTKELTLEEKLESLKEVCKSSLSNSIPIEEGNIGIDKNGVYMYNKDLGLRTSSYETMEKINNEEIKIIEGNR